MNAIPEETRAIAELRDVSVTYGTGDIAVPALRDISLKIHRGEILFVMGPSGSGKSTLLQVLGCMRRASKGTLLIHNTSTEHMTEDRLSGLRARHIGFVFQHYNLLPSLSAWENVALAFELRGILGETVEERSRTLMRSLGLKHRCEAYPDGLSGGEKQRVAIARAIAGNPDLILADEPTAALDAVSGAGVAALLAMIAHQQGRAVVVVTHDTRISGIADRIVYLDDGMIRRAELCSHGVAQGSNPNELEACNHWNDIADRLSRVSAAG